MPSRSQRATTPRCWRYGCSSVWWTCGARPSEGGSRRRRGRLVDVPRTLVFQRRTNERKRSSSLRVLQASVYPRGTRGGAATRRPRNIHEAPAAVPRPALSKGKARTTRVANRRPDAELGPREQLLEMRLGEVRHADGADFAGEVPTARAGLDRTRSFSSPRNIRAPQPRRRRDSSPRNICAPQPRRRRDSSEEDPRGEKYASSIARHDSNRNAAMSSWPFLK